MLPLALVGVTTVAAAAALPAGVVAVVVAVVTVGSVCVVAVGRCGVRPGGSCRSMLSMGRWAKARARRNASTET